MDWGYDELVGHALRQVARAEAPAIPLDTLFARWRRRRRRMLAAGVALLLLAASAAVAVAVWPEDPPVHLRLQLVDVPALEAPAPDPLRDASMGVP
jgi:hypothetical protein